MTQTVAFTVVGNETIHCEGCEARIGNALRRVPGVRDVRASHQTQRVVVTIDPAQVQADQVRAKLGQIGYEVAAADRSG